MTPKILIAASLAVAVLGAAGAASADELNVVCHARESRGASHRDFKRRLDIDFAKRTVAYYDDLGRGWVFKRQGPFVSADPGRIVLDAGEGKSSALDRRTGEYVFHNDHDGVTIRGRCEKTAAGKPLF